MSRAKHISLIMGAIALAGLGLFCLAGLFPNIDGTLDEESRPSAAVSFVIFSCVATVYYQAAVGASKRRIVSVGLIMLAVLSLVASFLFIYIKASAESTHFNDPTATQQGIEPDQLQPTLRSSPLPQLPAAGAFGHSTARLSYKLPKAEAA